MSAGLVSKVAVRLAALSLVVLLAAGLFAFVTSRRAGGGPSASPATSTLPPATTAQTDQTGPVADDHPTTLPPPTPGSSDVVTGDPSGDPLDTTIEPGEDIQVAVDANPPGTRFTIAAGVHRHQYVVPKDGNHFIGEEGAVLSGASLIAEFGREDGRWTIAGQTAEGEPNGFCEGDYDACMYPEQVFVDGHPLWQVAALSQLEPGAFYFDYEGDTIYLADDPAGRVVEVATTPRAFEGSARDVVIRGLTIEKYANPAQTGMIHGRDGKRGRFADAWLVEDNVIRWAAGEGIALGDRMVVRNNLIEWNGRTGIGAGPVEDALVEGNVLAYNCTTQGYACFGWGGGGLKIASSVRTVIRGNAVHDNVGAGLHVDVGGIDTTFESNEVYANSGAGIFIEISYGGVIRSNTVYDNGFGRPSGRAAGILVASSPDVTVEDNTVRGNAASIVIQQIERGSGPLGPYEVDRVYVTGNFIDMAEGFTGVLTVDVPDDYFATRTVVFEDNVYVIGDDADFVIGSDRVEPSDWRDAGFDSGSAGLSG